MYGFDNPRKVKQQSFELHYTIEVQKELCKKRSN